MTNVLTPGERFVDRYVVESLIAEGGMASIYRARDEKTRHLVAIKVLYPYYADNHVIRARFIEEGRIQQVLGHPNVVHVLQVVEEPLAIVMEHVDGITLDDFLAEQGQIDEEDMLDIIIPVMSAVGMAHSKGIIHRDLKPSNILLNRTRQGFHPKVMDFGVAKVKDAGHDLTATGTTVGTLHYMSPEQIVGSKSIDGRADIYSIGVTLYKLATGEVPFNAPTEFALMMAQVEAPPLPPSKLRPDLSRELESIILKAMEKKPADRFQSIRQFTTALLSMKRPGDSTVRDTITETISQELLDMAMAADEVAQDRTSEMNLRVVRAGALSEVDASMEPTVEIEKTAKMNRVTGDQEGDSTVELSNSQIMRIATMDDDTTNEDVFHDDFSDDESTHVLEKRVSGRARGLDEDSSQNITRPSRPVRRGSETSDSRETESLNKRVRMESGRVVVLDDDANSRDLTAPKVSEKEYQRAMGKESLPRPSGPKVVLGYNPADTQERTFEKPNFRTHLPAFKTSQSSDFEKPDAERPDRSGGPETPDPRRPSTDPDASPPLPPSDSKSLAERLDAAAGPSLPQSEDNSLPTLLLVAGVFAIMVIIGCVALVVVWVLVG